MVAPSMGNVMPPPGLIGVAEVLQQGPVAGRAGPGDEDIGIGKVVGCDLTAGQIEHLGKWFKYSLEVGDFVVGDDFHSNFPSIKVRHRFRYLPV